MEKFEIYISVDYFKRGEILENGEHRFRVIHAPTKHYSKWYWRILNFLTFRKFFNVNHNYIVKLID